MNHYGPRARKDMITLKSDSKEIDGVKFTTTQLPAMRSFKLLARLLKTIGPALGALTKLDPNTELDLASSGLAGAFSELDPNEAAALLPEILNMTTALVDGKEYPLLKPENIDVVFSGQLMMLFKALAFALQFNFSGFTPGTVPAVPAAVKAG